MRKKAKYLEDTPAEALMQDVASRGRVPVVGAAFPQQSMPGMSNVGDLFGSQPAGSASYALYPSGGQGQLATTSMSPPQQTYSMAPQGTSQAQSSMSQPPYQLDNFSTGTMSRSAPVVPTSLQHSSLDDLFPGSFDIEGFDFGDFDNRYGAAELGMLNHMSVGMANSPPSENTGTFNPSGSTYTPGTMSAVYDQSPSEETQYSSYQSNSTLGQWSRDPSGDVRSTGDKYHFKGVTPDSLEGLMRQDAPAAFAIGNSALPSPSSMSSPQGMAVAGFDDNPTNKNLLTNLHTSTQGQARQDHLQSRQRPGPSVVSASTTSTPSVKVQNMPSRRHRNPSAIYEDVKTPYSYTAAFHSLTALIQRRFSPHKTAHIAKALAAIRPSFISCTMKLNKDDLVFMEQCLQRTLWEYEDFISATATPTLICRRTGEVVAVGKEFSILTGWSANVLLGREPNLNVNRGGDDNSADPPGTGTSSLGGTNTPRNPNDTRTEMPVNIVDLLDDDSACEFFDDYAHLAFGDSRGSVTTPCKLLKYRTVHANNIAGNLEDQVGSRLKRRRDDNFKLVKPGSTSDVASTQLGGTSDGKVECMLCWSVKRDVFDIPMLCVLNVGIRAASIQF